MNFSPLILGVLIGGGVALGSVTVNADPAQAQPPMKTKWASDVTPDRVLPEYPRPQMVRTDWLNLNGPWNYAITKKEETSPVASYTGKILVPFPLQSLLSGVKAPITPDNRPPWYHQFENRLWYQRTFNVPDQWKGKRVLLHFGAVSWETTVYVNGKELGTHHGDYDGFSFDITDALKADGPQEVVLSVWDPINMGKQPFGKQSIGSYSIYYTGSTGIWQTVWLEPVAAASIDGLKIIPDVDKGVLKLTVTGKGTATGDTVEAVASDSGKEVSRISGTVGSELSLPVANARLWSPDNPFLYDLKIELRHGGQPVDSVTSYFGMRKIALGKDAKGRPRIELNGKNLFLLAALDQGFWPDGLYTAPTDDAFRYDIEMMKKYGFNTDRKHMKVEPERWYYWCDKLGLLVWQDMPCGAGNMASSDDRVSDAAAKQFEVELQAMLDGRGNHPCITTWTLFNESWGQYDTRRLTDWMKTYDPTRLVDSASGWTDFHVGDINDRHDYSVVPAAPRQDGQRASVLGECGAASVVLPGHIWQGQGGYPSEGVGHDPQVLATAYPKLFTALWPLIDSDGLCGAVYTQLTDVEKEPSGLLTYDRISKVDPALISAANHGGPFAAATAPTAAPASGPANAK